MKRHQTNQGQEHYRVRKRYWERLCGLLFGRDKRLQVFPHCDCLHTFGMRRPIDMAFVSPGGTIMQTHRGVGPFRIRRCKGAAYALERIASEEPWFRRNEEVNFL